MEGRRFLNNTPNTYAKPYSIPDDVWHNFYELAISVADFVLHAFDVYAMCRFGSCYGARFRSIESALGQVTGEEAIKGRNRVCEHILIEKMKEREYFCCDLCQEPMYNYKQALIHVMDYRHRQMENKGVLASGVQYVRRVLDLFTKLPNTLERQEFKMDEDLRRKWRRKKDEEDEEEEEEEDEQYEPNSSLEMKLEEQYRRAYEEMRRKQPNKKKHPFDSNTMMRVTPTVFETVVSIEAVKSPIGQKMMAALHQALGRGKSYCNFCCRTTGDRDGFYAHYISASHLNSVSKEKKKDTRIDIITLLVNVHRKDMV